MKVLILSQHYWPETFRINEIAESLRQVGCEVAVLTGQPNYPDGKTFSGYRAWGLGQQLHPAGYTIYRVPLAPRGRGNAVRLAANYLSFLTAASTLGPGLLRDEQFDVVFVYGSSPILQAIAAVVIGWAKGAAVITWVQDLWPQSLQATGFVEEPTLLRMVGAAVSWVYRRSDLLLVQSKAFIPTVRAMAGATPVEYHPNPGETSFEFPPALAGPALTLERGFNIVFAGNLGTVQSLETILDAAELLRSTPDVRIVLIGSGSRVAWLREAIGQRNLTSVSLPGRFAPEAMPGIFAQAEGLLVSLVRSPIMSQTVPSKVQAYLAAGRPIIASLDGEGADVVSEAAAGVTCPAEDPRALADAILKLYSSSTDARARMGRAGRAYYEANFEPTMLAKRLAHRFETLVASRRHEARLSKRWRTSHD